MGAWEFNSVEDKKVRRNSTKISELENVSIREHGPNAFFQTVERAMDYGWALGNVLAQQILSKIEGEKHLQILYWCQLVK